MVAIDDPENAAEISEAAVRSKVVVKVLIEVDIGINRCGVQPGDDVVRLAKQIADLRGIEFVGVMGWEGQCVRIADPHEKELECRRSVERLVMSAEMCRSEGLAAGIVSCGGSGTYWLTAYVPGVTEIQAGGAVLNSATYHQWGVDLGYALFLSASITSHVVSDRVVVDAGRKALGGGMVPPLPVGLDGVSEIRLNAEHGIIRFHSPKSGLRPGERVDFVPGDDIVFLHDKLFGVRDGVVEVVWDVLGRGKLS
jgi:D-serine deaminase-like pyridoxal phosphate-dependent protein